MKSLHFIRSAITTTVVSSDAKVINADIHVQNPKMHRRLNACRLTCAVIGRRNHVILTDLHIGWLSRNPKIHGFSQAHRKIHGNRENNGFLARLSPRQQMRMRNRNALTGSTTRRRKKQSLSSINDVYQTNKN